MFGRLMNRYYYGKSGKGDFTPDDLPENRWQLFWDVLRTRIAQLFRLNLIYVVIWLPALFVIALGFLNLFSLLSNITALSVGVQEGTSTAEALEAARNGFGDTALSMIWQTMLLLIPCIAITGPATAGLCYVTRNWARDEHAFLWADFKDAAKANWKQGLLTSVLTAVIYPVLFLCVYFYSRMASNMGALMMVPEVLCILLGVIWSGMLIYIYPQMVTYELSYRNLLKNSALLAVGNLPMTLAGRLLSLVPALIAVVVSFLTPYAFYAALGLGLYYVLLGYALSRFVGASITNAIFDKTINKNIPGVQVGRGLRKNDNDPDDEEKLGE